MSVGRGDLISFKTHLLNVKNFEISLHNTIKKITVIEIRLIFSDPSANPNPFLAISLTVKGFKAHFSFPVVAASLQNLSLYIDINEGSEHT